MPLGSQARMMPMAESSLSAQAMRADNGRLSSNACNAAAASLWISGATSSELFKEISRNISTRLAPVASFALPSSRSNLGSQKLP